MNLTTNFDIRKADSNLVKMLDLLEKRNENFYKRLRDYCADIDYYMDRGMNEEDAIGYVKFFYRNKNEK